MASAVPAASRRQTNPRVTTHALIPGALLVVACWAVVALADEHGSTSAFALMWLAMTVAMMLPTTVRPMLRAASGSPARAWAFTGGFCAVWFAAGVPAYLLMNAITWTPFWIAAAWLVAGVYQLTPSMHRLMRSCRSIRYDGSAVSFGTRQGLRCVASCGPLMIAVMVTAMALPGTVLPLLALVAITALMCWQNQPSTAPRAIAVVGMSMLLLAAGGYVLMGGGGAAAHHSAGSSTS